MGLQGHGALALERLHDLGDAEDGVEVVFLMVLGAFEGAPDAGKYRFGRSHAVADQHAADAGAQNTPAFNGRRVDEWMQVPAADDEAAENAHQQEDDSTNANHMRFLKTGRAPVLSAPALCTSSQRVSRSRPALPTQCQLKSF
jgi:hypothetical protein